MGAVSLGAACGSHVRLGVVLRLVVDKLVSSLLCRRGVGGSRAADSRSASCYVLCTSAATTRRAWLTSFCDGCSTRAAAAALIACCLLSGHLVVALLSVAKAFAALEVAILRVARVLFRLVHIKPAGPSEMIPEDAILEVTVDLDPAACADIPNVPAHDECRLVIAFE